MAAVSPPQALQRLRNLYRDAFKVAPANDEAVITWARSPELWATHQIAHRGWSYLAAEAVVRQCRILVRRATRAVEVQA